MESTPKQTAEDLYWDCYPHWYDNGHFMKMTVAKDYVKTVVKHILGETLSQYTTDENHDRVLFWKEVLKEVELIK